MSDQNWNQVWEVFHQIVEAEPQSRDQLLDQLCQQDLQLKSEILSLLEAHNQTDSLIDQPAHTLVEQAPQTILAGQQIGPYSIEKLIGSGGMGEVYLAHRHDGTFRQQVAIKFAAFARYSPALLERFETERQILSDLSHPAIARLYDGGSTEQGTPYLVMEYIQGYAIDDYCNRQKLDLNQRLTLFSQVCEAVQFAHRNLVIHRDIKPSNILVDEQGTPKLLDFGVAKLLTHTSADASLTAALGPIATPAYASPEQLQGQALSTASDVYSLGVLLFELLTGSSPYQVDMSDLKQAVKIICETTAPRPSQSLAEDFQLNYIDKRFAKQLKGDLDSIVAKCLNKQAEFRYASAGELAQDLTRHIGGKPVMAQADTLAYRTGKLFRRHPLSISSTILALIATVGFSAFTVKQARELQSALTQTRQEQQKTTRISAFLESLFEVSDPLRSKNPEMSARELLDVGLERLETELTQEPILKASMQTALGRVYANLSDHQTAKSLLTQSLSTLLTAYGAQHEQVLQTRLALANAYRGSNQFDLAKDQLQAALANIDVNSDPFLHSELELRLSWILGVLGPREQALQLAESGLERRRNVLPDNDIRIGDAQMVMASAFWYMGRYEDAEQAYRNANKMHTDQLGPNHHRSISSLTGVGIALLSQGNITEAKHIMQTILEKRIETLGHEHTLTADAHNRLGAIFYNQGSHMQQAAFHFEAALKIHRLNNTVTNPQLNSLGNLALVRRHQQRLDEAEDLFNQALEMSIEQFGPEHDRVATQRNNLGLVFLDKQAFSAAYEQFQAAYKIIKNSYGEEHLTLAFSMTNTARALIGQQNYEAAATWVVPALKIRQQQLDPMHPMLAESLSTYGELLLAQNNFAEAHTVLQQALEARESHFASDDWRTAETAYLLARSEWALEIDGAQQRTHDAVNILKRKLGADHWRTKAAVMTLLQMNKL